jgi:hypothetical protein
VTLSELFQSLTDEFGRRASLAKVSMFLDVCARLEGGDTLSISEVARATGEPISSVSRWVTETPILRVVADPTDERRRLVEIVDSSAYHRVLSIVRAFEAEASGEGAPNKGAGCRSVSGDCSNEESPTTPV